MNGIPVRIHRDESIETIYLSTRRTGESGEKIQQLKRQLHDHETEAALLFQRVNVLATKAQKEIEAGSIDAEKLAAICNEQEQLTRKAIEHGRGAQQAALEIVKLSLTEAYKADGEVDRILDSLSDRQIRAAVTAIETGEEPKDFFQLRATPASEPTT